MAADALDRTVGRLAAAGTTLLRAEETPDRAGFLQAVEPTTKLVGLVALVVVAAASDEPATLGALLALAVVLAAVSRVPGRRYAGRVAVPSALALVAVAPRAVLHDGPALVAGLPITEPGAAYVLAFVVRVAACVALLSLLPLTTRFAALIGALRRLRAPRTAVTMVAVTHRYLLLVCEELTRLVRARRSRRLREPDLRAAWRTAGTVLGTFLVRSLERGERVQRAARARGGPRAGPYDRPFTPGVADAAFGLAVAATLVGVALT